jgi:hypothetical protein
MSIPVCVVSVFVGAEGCDTGRVWGISTKCRGFAVSEPFCGGILVGGVCGILVQIAPGLGPVMPVGVGVGTSVGLPHASWVEGVTSLGSAEYGRRVPQTRKQ